MKDHNLLAYSLTQHQQLVDAIIQNADSDGVCRLSQNKFAKIVEKSQTWINKAIVKINTEDVCIVYMPCHYRVQYTDLSKQGVFSKIIFLMQEVIDGKAEYILTNRQDVVAEKYGIKIKTLQMFKSYLISFLMDDDDNADDATILAWINRFDEFQKLLAINIVTVTGSK